MNVRVSVFALGTALWCVALDSSAQSTPIDVQLTGVHRLVTGDTSESARQFARADADRQAVGAVAKALAARADLASLNLSAAELEAYVAALIDIEEPPPATAAAPAQTVRVSIRARLEPDSAARLLPLLQKDDDAARAIVTSWTESQELRRRIADQTSRRATSTTAAAAAIVAEQLEATTSLTAKRLVAQGAAALARTEPATIGGRTPSATGRQRARALANAALALTPDAADVHLLLGDLFVDAEEPESAEAEYRRALAADMASPVVRTKLAEALRLQGKFVEATAELRQVIGAEPTYAQAHSDLAMILRADRKIPEAIASYREAIRLDPRSTDAHNGLAITLAGAQQPEEAVVEFQAIVDIDPDSTIGYYNLATVLAGLDRDIEAAAALRQVLRTFPDHYNARYNIAEMLRLEGKYDDSAAQFKEYLRLAPDTPQNRRNIDRAKRFVAEFTNP